MPEDRAACQSPLSGWQWSSAALGCSASAHLPRRHGGAGPDGCDGPPGAGRPSHGLVVWLASSRTYVVCGHTCPSAESRREFGIGADDCVSVDAGAPKLTANAPAASERGSDAHCRVALPRGRLIGRSDPDTSHQGGRSFDGASPWCRLGPACESPCVERPARTLRLRYLLRSGGAARVPPQVAPDPARPTAPNRSRCRRDHDQARDWFTCMGIVVVAIQLEPAS